MTKNKIQENKETIIDEIIQKTKILPEAYKYKFIDFPKNTYTYPYMYMEEYIQNHIFLNNNPLDMFNPEMEYKITNLDIIHHIIDKMYMTELTPKVHIFFECYESTEVISSYIQTLLHCSKNKIDININKNKQTFFTITIKNGYIHQIEIITPDNTYVFTKYTQCRFSDNNTHEYEHDYVKYVIQKKNINVKSTITESKIYDFYGNHIETQKEIVHNDTGSQMFNKTTKLINYTYDGHSYVLYKNDTKIVYRYKTEYNDDYNVANSKEIYNKNGELLFQKITLEHKKHDVIIDIDIKQIPKQHKCHIIFTQKHKDDIIYKIEHKFITKKTYKEIKPLELCYNCIDLSYMKIDDNVQKVIYSKTMDHNDFMYHYATLQYDILTTKDIRCVNIEKVEYYKIKSTNIKTNKILSNETYTFKNQHDVKIIEKKYQMKNM